MTTDELILLNMRNEYLRKDRDYQTAENCYAIADAMLAARKETA